MASGVVEAKAPRWGREGEPPSRDASLWRLMRVFWRAMTGLRLPSALSRMCRGDCPIMTWGFTVETGAASQAGRTWFIKNVADSSSLARKHAMGRPVPPGALFRGAIRDSGAEEGAAGSSCARSRRLPVARILTAGPFRIHGERGRHFVAELFPMVGGKIGNHRAKRDHHGPTRSGIRKMPHGGGCLLLGLALMIGVPALAVDEAAPAPPEQSASQAVGESAPANPESANTDDATAGATVPTARRRRRPRTTRRFRTIPRGPRPPVVLTGRKTLSIRRIPPTRRTRAATPTAARGIPRRRGLRPC